MRYVTLPQTTLTVSGLCLGAGALGSALDRKQSFALLDAFHAAGGTFLDTARVYADWLPNGHNASEKTIGLWLKQRRLRGRVIVATKGAHPPLHSMHVGRMSPQEIRSDVDESLRWLQVDAIDLYYLHRDDVTHPVTEILETLEELVKAGKVRYYGCSNWRTGRIAEAQAYATGHALHGFAANQMLWSLAAVDGAKLPDPTLAAMDAGMYAFHQETGLAAVPYTSQANGYFQRLAAGTLGKLGEDQRRLYDTPENRARFERVRSVAQEGGLTITQVVLAYLQSQPFVTVPVIGCKTVEQLADSLRAADVLLTPQQAADLDGGRVSASA